MKNHYLNEKSCRKEKERYLLLIPLLSIIILPGLTIRTFLVYYQKWMTTLAERIELQHRQNLIQIAIITRNIIEPVIIKYRTGKTTHGEALTEIRKLVRQMKYPDEYSNNYAFMSSYDGTMLL